MVPLMMDAAVLAAFVPHDRAAEIVVTAPRRFAPGVIDGAKHSQAHWNIPASMSGAQYGLESGWGAHMPPGSNNPFGIKARAGEPAVMVDTREWSKARGYYYIHTGFKRFVSIDDAFDQHGRLLGRAAPYAHARSLLPARGKPLTDAHVAAFANALTGVYATAPDYGTALLKLIHDNGLRSWDGGW